MTCQRLQLPWHHQQHAEKQLEDTVHSMLVNTWAGLEHADAGQHHIAVSLELLLSKGKQQEHQFDQNLMQVHVTQNT